MTEILTPFLAALIVAYIFQPVVGRLVACRIPKPLAAIATVILAIGIAMSLVLLLLNLLAHELPLIKKQFPEWVNATQTWLAPKLASLDITLDWDKLRNSLTQKISSQLSDNADTLVSSTLETVLASSSSIIGGLVNLVLILFILFYLLVDGRHFFEYILNLMPTKFRSTFIQLANETDLLLSQYLRGQMLVIVMLACFYALGLSLIGVRGAIPLGVFTGLVIIIPFVGILLGFCLALTAGFLQFGFDSQVFNILVLFGVGQMLEGFFLTPKFVGERIGLHPVAALFALLLFGQLFGFFGILLALPMAAICSVGIRFARERYTNSEWYKSN